VALARGLDPAGALPAGAPALAPCPDLALARALLERYTPAGAAQADFRARMLSFVDAHPADAHRRELLVGHLTASALVVDASGERALLTHHRKLDRWLQLGGHCDGDANLPGVALRECLEESGIPDLRVLPQPLDLHLDTRFLVLAPPGAVAVASAESHELGWFTRAELERLECDASVRRLFEQFLA
jgi:8-oxo-dGTP pyrophosphatase MutT (NUDIX family)